MITASIGPAYAAASDSHTGLGSFDLHALRCADCGRVVPCSMDDIVRFSDLGWPRCCDEVMSLDSPVGPGR